MLITVYNVSRERARERERERERERQRQRQREMKTKGQIRLHAMNIQLHCLQVLKFIRKRIGIQPNTAD